MRKHSTLSKLNRFSTVLFLSCLCIFGYESKAQLSYKVLFLGNSYTYVNNLPQLVHDVALSAGDTLVFDSYAPGGYQFVNHFADSTSHQKIRTGGWDYVILQGQSQEPVLDASDFTNGGNALFNLVKQYNPCAVIMPYMTWGRKNGDALNCASFPVMCTYEGMDTSIRNAYLSLTAYLNGEVAPVSVVWNYTRQNYPTIDLYQPDESHPSAAGSYAAACCFYTSIFKKDPALINFDFGLNASDASILRNAAKTQVFDSLQRWDYKKLPVADFRYRTGPGSNEVILSPVSHGVRQTCYWDFGDGDTSTTPFLTHSYLSDGTYTVSLTTTTCDLQGWHTSMDDTIIQFCSHTPTVYTSLPWVCNFDTLWTQTADSYQWFTHGVAIPETNPYLPNYHQYNIGSFSVLTTVNGCSELSEEFAANPLWSGYYFDGVGTPCVGDTVAFAVLHINGYLSGLETIQWLKNDSLLPFMTNEDTLWITTEGKYECRVVNPSSNCPLDTTYSILEYACGVAGIIERDKEISWTLFPNPASETITIQFFKYPVQEPMQIYSAIGCLMKTITPTASTTKINIADLPNGFYYIRLKNKPIALKFIKQ